MKKSEIYFYLSIASIISTFVLGIGFFMSIILLILIISEKNKLANNYNLNEIQEDLQYLNRARKLTILNIAINIVLIILALIFILIFFVMLAGDENMWKFFGS